MADIENVFKVKLENRTNGIYERVSFDVSPDIIETRNVNYKSLEPIHMPGTVQVYNNSSSRSYNISNIKLISRTQREATINLYRLNILRAWTTPVFGEDILTSEQRFDRDLINPGTDQERRLQIQQEDLKIGLGLGTPPPVLRLSAYSNPKNQKKTHGNINNVPVVISQMSIPYPSDVDYIPTMDGKDISPTFRHIHANIPMPTLMVIDITCMETHSPNEYSKFNLSDFKKGQLKGF